MVIFSKVTIRKPGEATEGLVFQQVLQNTENQKSHSGSTWSM